MVRTGREFYKMSGSGNDFVFVDTRSGPVQELDDPAAISAICARGTGIGADGIVFLGNAKESTLAIRYFNSDGSLAALCGNATLCAARLAIELGMAPMDREFTIATGSGVIAARLRDGRPEIDLQPVTELQTCFEARVAEGEQRIGFALVGVPHLVVLCADVESTPVLERGRQLRFDGRLPHGANVNFVSGSGGHWIIRTYERGVENETLACGTGAVATALLLSAWGAQREDPVALETRSGRILHVRQRGEGGQIFPSLSGEARIVFTGRFAELPSTLE